jgi:hypothetical protein
VLAVVVAVAVLPRDTGEVAVRYAFIAVLSECSGDVTCSEPESGGLSGSMSAKKIVTVLVGVVFIVLQPSYCIILYSAD